VKHSDAEQLMHVLHQAALDSGHFPDGGMRTLLFPAASSFVARDNAEASFVFISVKILPGRTLEVREEIGRLFFTVAEEHAGVHLYSPCFSNTPGSASPGAPVRATSLKRTKTFSEGTHQPRFFIARPYWM